MSYSREKVVESNKGRKELGTQENSSVITEGKAGYMGIPEYKKRFWWGVH